jgi:hypothetical protein
VRGSLRVKSITVIVADIKKKFWEELAVYFPITILFEYFIQQEERKLYMRKEVILRDCSVGIQVILRVLHQEYERL